MIKIFNNKGFSLVELLISIVVTSVILGAIMMSFTTSLRVFRDAKSISDNIETKTPSIELISRYFDRWGVGVASKKDLYNCNNCPLAHKTITISTSGGCSDVTFYGNLYGFGFVRNVSSGTAQLISCRLNAASEHNCYTVWRDNSLTLHKLELTNNNLIPFSLSPSNLNRANNVDCSGLSAGATHNATMNETIVEWSYPSNPLKKVAPGDVIQRAAHRIRLYCANNPSDANRKWLYVDLTEQYGYCTENENALPIAPVESFNVQALPSGCNAANGECKALNVTITFRSPSQRHGGQFDTFTITRVFGR